MPVDVDGSSVSEPAAPGSPASLREANQHRVIAALRQGLPGRPALTQADIARTTLLAPATVSNIVKDLAAVGLVESHGRGGRRGSAVRISPRAGIVLGIALSHAHLRVALGDLGGEVLGEATRPLAADHKADEAVALVEAVLPPMLDASGHCADEIVAIGLGLPSPIGADGVVASTSILPGWVSLKAGDYVADRLGVPVHVDNDANLGALAEARWGAGRGHDFLAHLEVSSGLGAGLIFGGQIFHGGTGAAGEIGHLTVNENGPVCRCGSRGCLEAYTSSGMVQQMLATQHPGANIEEIVSAARAGDTAAARVLEDAGRQLGRGVATLANLLNPTCIVVGGSMASAGDLLLDPLRNSLRRHALPEVAGPLEVVTSTLRERAPVLGALLLALDRAELPLPS